MVWPQTITTDLDLQTFGQGAERLLEKGQNFAQSHIEAARAVAAMLRKRHGVNADEVTNATDYKRAAAYYVFSMVLLSKNQALSEDFNRRAFLAVGDILPLTAALGSEGGGGMIAPRIYKSGAINSRGTGAPSRYRKQPPGTRYGR